MNLRQILKQIKHKFSIIGDHQIIDNIHCNDIVIDSRQIKENSIFFGVIGTKLDGAYFLPDIVKLGCRVAFISANSAFDSQNFVKENPNFIVIIGDIDNLLIAVLNIFYPNLPQNIYAVTGTNGKTSVAEFTRQILQILNIKSASIGTLGIKTTDNLNLGESGLTTPDIVSLYKNLAILKQNNIDDIALEVSSIGLHQNRTGAIKIKCGAFTNFTQDHLDYHKNMENYFACKMILFEKIITQNGYAVLNADIKEFATLKQICQKNNLTIFDYGFNAEIFKIKNISRDENLNYQIKFIYNHQEFNFTTQINGDFQIYNILCALAMVVSNHHLNLQQIDQLVKKFDKLHCASGRMQKVGEYRGAKIFIDFAHTPDALENVLKLARNIATNRVIILFGCGGDRDSKKRPLMGEIASKLADVVIITDDNPRTENPELIRQQIITKSLTEKTIEIADRKIAIDKTIRILQDGDVLIIAGKGHENYQIIGAQKIEFNEAQIVTNAIQQISTSQI